MCRHESSLSKADVIVGQHGITPKEIGERLAVIREAYQMRPTEAADSLGWERPYWSRFENGHRVITPPFAAEVAERFNVTLDYIFLGRKGGLSVDVAERIRKAEEHLASER